MNGQSRAPKPIQTHPIKHVPQRTCVVCRTTTAKRTLTRLVRLVTTDVAGDNAAIHAPHIQLDPTGKRNGRGAYLCDQTSCWQRAVDTDVLAKALRMTFSDTDRMLLRQIMPRAMPDKFNESSVAPQETKSTNMVSITPHTAAKRQ